MSSDAELEDPSLSRQRLSRPELFMRVAWLYAHRSSCLRAEVGAVAVRDGRILATGYVGAPTGMPHCLDVGCKMEHGHCVRTIHAEANLVAWSARVGISLEGCRIYSTHAPCRPCAMLLGNAGIASLVWEEGYRPNGLGILEKLNVELVHLDHAL